MVAADPPWSHVSSAVRQAASTHETSRRASVMTAKATANGDSLALVSGLVEAADVDTVYGDVYLGRARTRLDPVLSVADFERIEQQRVQLAELSLSIGRAIQLQDWPLVKALSSRAEAIRRTVRSRGKLTEVARAVYALGDVKL